MKLDSLNNSLNNIVPTYDVDQWVDTGLGVNMVIILITVAGALFGFFYLLKKYMLPLLDSSKAIKKAKLLAFRIEVVVWLLFALIAITQFFTASIWITAGLLVVIGLVGLNFWRDFFPGLLLRVSSKFKINDLVRIQGHSGTLEKLGITSIHIKTDEEELIYIPYRKVTTDVFVKRQAKGKLMSSKIILQIGAKDPNMVVDSVADWIHQCPWAIPQSTNNAAIHPGGLLHITVYAIDSISLGKVERFIQEKVRE
ncbi:MAG: mechanosensitive ion channel [Crocinitomix sp.]|nr:mechanosensitive ion channel [Crocinitomix sp.]